MINEARKIYLVGIKGSGMVALAEIFLHLKKKVTGSDEKNWFFTDEVLKKLRIRYYEGFSRENIEKERPDLVVYSTAYNEKQNEELSWAVKLKIPRLSYPEAIGELMKDKYGIAVCGTHGKTTTSAMLALALRACGKDPTAIVGSRMVEVGSNAIVGKGKFFVVEADEYQRKFLHYNPMAVILTSLDFDHPDYFVDFNDYKNVFRELIKKIPAHGCLVASGEDADVVEVATMARCKVVFYGIDDDRAGKKRIIELFEKQQKRQPDFYFLPKEFQPGAIGRHNQLNAAAVLAMSEFLKLEQELVKNSLIGFRGTSRRFEKLGERNGALIYDDYAHHPREISETLKAIRKNFSKRNIICVFHPHTFTRTKALLDDFAQSFSNADEVIVIDIYGSAREKSGTISSADLVEKIKKFHHRVSYIPTMDEVYNNLVPRLTKSDLVVMMGAGNICDLGVRLVKEK